MPRRDGDELRKQARLSISRTLRWSVAPGPAGYAFRMSRSEREGPKVPPPQRNGFGRTVMERMIAATLGATATLEFAPEGIVWTLSCPAQRALEAPASST
jgi:two-component sensor histidine kinase